jgi:hypothetical protein
MPVVMHVRDLGLVTLVDMAGENHFPPLGGLAAQAMPDSDRSALPDDIGVLCCATVSGPPSGSVRKMRLSSRLSQGRLRISQESWDAIERTSRGMPEHGSQGGGYCQGGRPGFGLTRR